MPKIFVKQSTAFFSIIVLILLMLSVGLLVAILKGQIYHENLTFSTVSNSQKIVETTVGLTERPIDNDIHEKFTDSIVTELDDSTLSTHIENVPQRSWENFRLPSHVIPVHYNLLIHPDLKTDNFTGNAEILINVTRTVNHFVVHAYKLSVVNVRVKSADDGEELVVKKSFYYDPNEFFVIELEYETPPGLYKLGFTFSGTMAGSIVGLYKSRYKVHETGETRYLATSKFQPTYARRAFPCFDEPTFKSTFTVSMVHDADYIALSNMPAEETIIYDENRDLRITRFQKSVPMVTYLTCFIVCDFKYKSVKTKGGKEFRVYATEAGINHSSHALEFGKHVLDYFEKYFDIEYSLPKQDMVAIPDFVSGAMEHWGVITFRETNLLYNPLKSSLQNKQRVSSVISHEMAHMWFGNLVTMEWWDDLWLNEGFASYIEYKGVNEQYPEWDMPDQFVAEDLQPVLDLDSTMSSHPIVQPVSHPDEITEIFDDISYNKGASILRMLEFFMGEENFRRGISQFLKKYQFRNAKTEDLWTELSRVNTEQEYLNISAIMNTWTVQMGFPYITVVREDKNSSRFLARQQRFVKNPDLFAKNSNSSQDFVWHVPLSYVTSNGQSGIIWLQDKSEKAFEIPFSEGNWVKFNVNQTGYYIVNPEENDWRTLIHLLNTNHEALTPSDRSSLLHDAFLLSEAGLTKYDILLSLTKYLKNETHLIPWETAYGSLVHLSQVLEMTDVHSLMMQYIKELTERLYDKLEWKETTNHLDNLLQNTIVGLACYSGNKNCLNTASSLFQNWTQGHEIPSAMKRLIYHYGMAEIGREEHWNYMWDRYLKEESPQEKKILLYGLAHIREPALIYRFLEFSMDESKIRRQDFFTVLRYLAGNPTARKFVWNFIRDKWTYLVERFTLNDRYLGLIVKRVCSYFTDENDLKQMRQFFKKYPEAGAGTRRRKQALENVQNNIHWIKKYKDEIKSWLELESVSPYFHYRLPPHVVPLHYDLTLQPDADYKRFNGSVLITVNLEKESDKILFNVANLNISKVEVTDSNTGSIVPYKTKRIYERNNCACLEFDAKLPIGEFVLHFEFAGTIGKDYKGMFKVPYIDPDTQKKRYVIATQMESIHARKVFPCFDEPAFKSTFSIHVVHSATTQALSNAMEIESVIIEKDLSKTSFKKSVLMPTYLVCIAIGDFRYKESVTENAIRLRVYSTAHNVERTSYSLALAEKLLRFYEDYFQQSYPLEKLDMIAIPGFPGGMENWGLITYGESNLLIDANSSSTRDEVLAANLISHELAHMWFGNLVTMSWWNDLWLKEGFATYMASKAVQAIQPSWNLADEFISNRLYGALKKDGTSTSHPIVKAITSITQISEMFDAISYNKGASILQMLQALMGTDFQKAISSYLKKYAFKSVNTDDLWSELTLASSQKLDVKSLMTTWTMQMNYPYINVRQVGTDGIISVQQQHFLENQEDKHLLLSPYGFIWHIPLTYYTSNRSHVQSLILNSTEEEYLNITGNEWIKFNSNFSGYYLVNYEPNLWKKFTLLLRTNHSIFSQTDRANFLYDSFALARAGHLSYDVPLNLSAYLRYESGIVPWETAYKIFEEISSLLNNRTSKELMRHYVKTLSEPLFTQLTWNDTGGYAEKNLRNLIINVACRNKNYKCLSQALELLKRWMKGEDLDSNIRHLVYMYGMQSIKDETSWMFMWSKYLNESSSREKVKLLQGLANTRNRTLLKKLMSFAEDESKVMRGHYFKLLSYINNNPIGHVLVSDFIHRNWTELVQRFSLRSFSLGQFVKDIYGSFNTEEKLKDVMNFFRKYPKAGAGKTARTEALKKIQTNIKWLENHQESIENWMNDNIYMPWKVIRLPPHVTPSKYNIYIHPNISTSDFEGNVNITVNVTELSDHILVHSDQMQISNTIVRDAKTGETVPIKEAFPFELNQFWVITFGRNISSGLYYLYFDFSGRVSAHAEGLSSTSYVNNMTQEKRTLLYTQFEPIYARTMFPCFDEPSLKATFRLTVVHDPEYSAISNMPEENITVRSDGYVEVDFMESSPMSTYLVCIVVSDYQYTETEMSFGKKLRYFAPPDRLNKTLHTLNITPEMLERFEEFYDIPYTLPKLDFVSVPNFPMGGMENWGLIVLGEELLLDENPSLTSMMNSDKVVAHELAHQWFGNLVTMRWWDDIWLNEGFSSFAMYSTLNHFYPDSHGLVAGKKANVMMKDASQYSRPIVKQVRGRVEIVNMFDSISYEKGASIINMLQNVLKSDFKKGLSNYLKKYAYNNAETTDLWNELSDASDMDIDVAAVMDTWTLQMGFPYVEIEIHENEFKAKQKRFVEEYEADPLVDESPYGYLWKIPLTYKDIDTGEEHSCWLNEEEATFPLATRPGACLKFNVNFTGYYIVKYDEKSWDLISKKLQSNHEIFSETDRYNLLFDVTMLMQEDMILYDVALETTKYLRNEKSQHIWKFIIQEFFAIFYDHFLHDLETCTLLKKYLMYLSEDLYDDFQKNETAIDSHFEHTFSYIACISENEKCLENKREKLDLWLSDQSSKTVVTPFSYILSIYGNLTMWEKLWHQLNGENVTAAEQTEIIVALAQFRDPDIIKRTLNEVILHDTLGTYSVFGMLYQFRKNPVALPILWSNIKSNWEILSEKMNTRERSAFASLLGGICKEFSTEEQMEDMKETLRLHPEIFSMEDEIACFVFIEKNIEWVDTHTSAINTWLRWNVPSR